MHRYVCIGLLFGIMPTFARAQGQPNTLTAEDGQSIAITYYPASDKVYKEGSRQEVPIVVLLHGADEQGRILWDKGSAPRTTPELTFPLFLQEEGFAVITVDLRKFGESKAEGVPNIVRPIDYEYMAAGDLAAVKEFIFQEHQKKALNMNRLGVIAAGPTVPVALAFAANDWALTPYDDAPVLENRTPRGQDVRALVLLSPETGSGRLTVARPISFLRQPELNVATLVVVGTQDPHDRGQAEKVYDMMAIGQKNQDAQRVYLVSPTLKDRGVHLMGKQPEVVEAAIRAFLVKHLKDIDSTWRDRRNKVTGG